MEDFENFIEDIENFMEDFENFIGGFWKFHRGYWKFHEGFWKFHRGFWKFHRGYWKFHEGFWKFHGGFWKFHDFIVYNLPCCMLYLTVSDQLSPPQIPKYWKLYFDWYVDMLLIWITYLSYCEFTTREHKFKRDFVLTNRFKNKSVSKIYINDMSSLGMFLYKYNYPWLKLILWLNYQQHCSWKRKGILFIGFMKVKFSMCNMYSLKRIHIVFCTS